MKFVPHREISTPAMATSIVVLAGGRIALGDTAGAVTFLDPSSGAVRVSPPPPEPEFFDSEDQEAVPAGTALGGPLVTPDGGTAVVLYSLGALVVDLPAGTVRHRLSRDAEYAEEEGDLAGLPWAAVPDPARGQVALLYSHPDDGVNTIFWDLESGAATGALHGPQLQAVLPVPHRRQWLIADVDGNLASHDLDSFRPVHTLQRAAATADDRLLHSIAADRQELRWDTVIAGMVSDATAGRVLTARKDGTIVILETRTGAILHTHDTGRPDRWDVPGANRLLALHPDGDTFLLPTPTDLALLDVATGTPRIRWHPVTPVTRCSFLPTADLILTVAAERTVQLWHPEQQRPVAQWTADADLATWALSPDGWLILTQTDTRCVLLRLTDYDAPGLIDSLHPPRAYDGLPV